MERVFLEPLLDIERSLVFALSARLEKPLPLSDKTLAASFGGLRDVTH